MKKKYLVKLGNGFITDNYKFTINPNEILNNINEFLLEEKEADKLAEDVGGDVLEHIRTTYYE